MYQIENTIGSLEYKDLSIRKLASFENQETLLICLEKGHTFPEHSSPRDALLVMIEGTVVFTINGQNFTIAKHQSFQFPANEKHHVFGVENSKFLIIR